MQGFGTNFSNYTPPYLYLLWLATLTSTYVPNFVAIKIDLHLRRYGQCVLVYRIARLKYPSGCKPILAGLLFWILPTVMVNSSLWGQADAIYTFCLLACIYFLVTDRPLLSVFAFGVAFAFKAQAIFIFPLLAVFFLRRKIAWPYFLAIPLILFWPAFQRS